MLITPFRKGKMLTHIYLVMTKDIQNCKARELLSSNFVRIQELLKKSVKLCFRNASPYAALKPKYITHVRQPGAFSVSFLCRNKPEVLISWIELRI